MLLAAVALIAGLYVLALAALFFLQQRMLFFPERLPPDFAFLFRGAFEERWIGQKPGQRMHSLFFPAAGSAGTIVYFHGNAGSLSGWGAAGEQLASRSGFSVWMIDYPGYGKSEGGLPSEAGLRDAATAVYAAAVQEERGDERRVVVFGRSIGTGLAIRLAAERNPGGLILESPYDSLQSLARNLFPWAPAFLVRFPLRSDLDAPRVRCPALIVHGDRDEVIPFRQGEQLSRRILGVTLVRIEGGHHNDLASFETYWRAIDSFVARLRK
jgi:uncharacterized protein